VLPASNSSFEKSIKERCIFLSDALTTQSTKDLSPIAAQIVLVSLCGSKLAEIQRYDPAVTPAQAADSIWLKPQKFGDALTTEFVVPEHLSIPVVQPLDASTAFLNMSAFSGTISVHRAVRARLGEDAVSEAMLSQSRKLCVEAASKIVTIMKVTSHWDICSVCSIPSTAHTQRTNLTANSSILGRRTVCTLHVLHSQAPGLQSKTLLTRSR
jgi:hypothetical protein